MSTRLDRWSRLHRALDALSLTQLLGTVAAFLVWRGSPLYALGVVLALPVVAAAGVLVLRWLYTALTGRTVGFGALDPRYRAPRELLGKPLGERVSRDVVRTNARHDSRPLKLRRVQMYPSRQGRSALADQ
jgi:hypothetical protein